MRIYGNLLDALRPDYVREEEVPRCPRRIHAIRRLAAARGWSFEAAGEWLDQSDAEAFEAAVFLANTCDPARFVVWGRFH
jgi:hypothetical protein